MLVPHGGAAMQFIAATPGWFVIARFPEGRMDRTPVAAWADRGSQLVPMIKGGPGKAGHLAPADEVYPGAALELLGPSAGPAIAGPTAHPEA
ncbi:MAG: hypothetical protein KIT58_23685 [Planctomycetota bacterium]|nr:hypothetical protein [Planctomycetota bacterium]